MPTEFAHAMRSAELALAMQLLPSGGRILELGAGDGWQASILMQHGFTVSAVDVKGVAPGAKQFAPVTIYDGLTLPFSDGDFDAVFSSNVLEHVKDFAGIQAELARVLKPGGIAVHCVPSATWRFWTTVGHPIYALRWVLSSRQRRTLAAAQAHSWQIARLSNRNGIFGLLRLGLIAPRHGEYGNGLTECYHFSRFGWRRRLTHTGWQIRRMQPTALFYSGNELLGLRMSTRFRRLASRLIGSSTLIFIVRPSRPTPKLPSSVSA